ncbi:MAG: alpha/beta hydrolase [Alphaproteobacteria bacterium]|nr:alpha/beta hydrolase [Alphaproteobacteria bacterium]
MDNAVIACVQGWALGTGFWDPMRKRLPYDSVTVDLSCPDLAVLPADRPVVAVGHSTGVLWLLADRPFPWAGVVSINGFSRFYQGGGFPNGVPARVIGRMRQGLRLNALRVVYDFLARCGVKDGTTDWPTARLDWGLELLMSLDVRGRDFGPMLALAGRDDPIAPLALVRDCFSEIQVMDGGHLLPQTDPAGCASRIRDFVEGL